MTRREELQIIIAFFRRRLAESGLDETSAQVYAAEVERLTAALEDTDKLE